jgi:hypothetical protein
VLGEEVDDARLGIALTAARGRAPIARAPRSRTPQRASRSGLGWRAIVGVGLIDLQLGVYERPPHAVDKLISVVLIGEHLGRHGIGEQSFGVTSRNLG